MSIKQNMYLGPYLRVTKLEPDQTLDRLIEMGLVTEHFSDLMQSVAFEGNPLIECYIPNVDGTMLEPFAENCLDLSFTDIGMEKDLFKNAYPDFINCMANASSEWDLCYGLLRWYP